MKIIFIGASGHGKVCAEIAEMNGYNEILFLDDNTELKICGNHPVIGIEDDFIKFVDQATDFFVSIGNTKARSRIQERIKGSGGKLAILIHPESIISRDVQIGVGTVVMAGAVINPGTIIGDGVIVNTCSSIDHDCTIGEYSHIAVGAHLCGEVKVDDRSWIGAGAVVSNNLNLCGGCMVGAGAAVVRNIEIPGIYIGIPARRKERD